MVTFRLISWNCHHGSLTQRVAELAASTPALVFLQECTPGKTLPPAGQLLTRQVNARKGIALGTLSADYRLTALKPSGNPGLAMIGATVSGPVSFTALGIWSQPPRYADDVIQTLNVSIAITSRQAIFQRNQFAENATFDHPSRPSPTADG